MLFIIKMQLEHLNWIVTKAPLMKSEDQKRGFILKHTWFKERDQLQRN